MCVCVQMHTRPAAGMGQMCHLTQGWDRCAIRPGWDNVPLAVLALLEPPDERRR